MSECSGGGCYQLLQPASGGLWDQVSMWRAADFMWLFRLSPSCFLFRDLAGVPEEPWEAIKLLIKSSFRKWAFYYYLVLHFVQTQGLLKIAKD